MSETQVEPVWKRPGWITAIAGLITALLTIPEVVGNYLSKQQDILLEQQKTESIRLRNSESKQEYEFKIVNNTLAKQGPERIFVLRYLAATLDDDDAKLWAKQEVSRLDKLATTQAELVEIKRQLEKTKFEFSRVVDASAKDSAPTHNSFDDELNRLNENLLAKDAEIQILRNKVAEAKSKAGLSSFIDILFNTEGSYDFSKLRKVQGSVDDIIRAWNYSYNGRSNDNLMLSRDSIDRTIKRYESLDIGIEKASLSMQVYYLYNLAILRVIHTDIYREKEQVFLARNEIKKALALFLNTRDIEDESFRYFAKYDVYTKLRILAMNIDIFTFLSAEDSKYKSLAIEKLESLGGCESLYGIAYWRKDIYDVLNCTLDSSPKKGSGDLVTIIEPPPPR